MRLTFQLRGTLYLGDGYVTEGLRFILQSTSGAGRIQDWQSSLAIAVS
jgi:hypothetical protein